MRQLTSFNLKMENNNFIITINREFGTGGKEIAQKLGSLLGVNVYDKIRPQPMGGPYGWRQFDDGKNVKPNQKNLIGEKELLRRRFMPLRRRC